jgi:hypothetical protein
MAEALIDSNCDLSSVVKGNPSQYVKLNVGGSLHYTTIGIPYSDGVSVHIKLNRVTLEKGLDRKLKEPVTI